MARPNPLRKQAGVSEELFRQQSNTEAAYGAISRSILLDGTLVENINLAPTATLVEHKLGRASRGYIICKSSNAASVFSAPNPQDSSLFESLSASAPVTVSIWFF